MNKQVSIYELVLQLWGFIGPRRRWQLMAMVVLTVLSSFAEIFSIGAVIPFLSALTNPTKILENSSFQSLLTLLKITNSQELILGLTIIFGISVVLAGVLRLMMLWGNAKLSFYIGAELSSEIYRKCLYQPYIQQINRNSSDVIATILSKVDAVIFGVISPLQTLLSSIVILAAILVALLFISPLISLSIFSIVSGVYLTISLLMRAQLNLNGNRVSKESGSIAKSLQESLGGIRDILIDGTQEIYCESFRRAAFALRRAQGGSFFIGQSPRLIMEMLGMIAIAIVAYEMARDSSGLLGAVPILGALALAAQRLLPAFQQIYSSWASLRSSSAHLSDILLLLNLNFSASNQAIPQSPIPFEKYIKLKNVGFRYTCDSKPTLEKLNLIVNKGERVGVIGSTGGGKSTFLDLLMGLLHPTEGSIYIDDQELCDLNCASWQMRIAHVPQAIYLADTSIAQNIAFGIPTEEVDIQLVRLAANRAQISEEIESWADGYNTRVGERGVRLSGGQRQRIGIARAFYKKSDVIIFDEATSALDQKTEELIMDAINGLANQSTIFMVAHRLSTLKDCDKIIEISNGKIIRTMSYSEVAK